MLKLKLQYFGHLMWRADSWEKTLMLGGIRGGERRGRQRMRWLDGITDSEGWVWVNSGSGWWTGRPGMLQSRGLQRVGYDWVTELNWTDIWLLKKILIWLHWILVMAREIFSCDMWTQLQHMGSSSMTREWTWAPYQPGIEPGPTTTLGCVEP